MPSPRLEIDPYVEPLLREGETELSYLRRTAVMAALREKFPGVGRSTLVSAIVRVLRERRKNLQERAKTRKNPAPQGAQHTRNDNGHATL